MSRGQVEINGLITGEVEAILSQLGAEVETWSGAQNPQSQPGGPYRHVTVTVAGASSLEAAQRIRDALDAHPSEFEVKALL